MDIIIQGQKRKEGQCKTESQMFIAMIYWASEIPNLFKSRTVL